MFKTGPQLFVCLISNRSTAETTLKDCDEPQQPHANSPRVNRQIWHITDYKNRCPIYYRYCWKQTNTNFKHVNFFSFPIYFLISLHFKFRLGLGKILCKVGLPKNKDCFVATSEQHCECCKVNTGRKKFTKQPRQNPCNSFPPLKGLQPPALLLFLLWMDKGLLVTVMLRSAVIICGLPQFSTQPQGNWKARQM